LQGNSEQTRRRREQFELMQVHWSPTARLLTSAAGSALTLYGIRQRTLGGIGLAVAGLSLLARGLTNTELSRFLQLRERSRRADEVDRGTRSQEEGSLGARKQVKDVMTRQVEVIHPDRTLEEAAEKMKALDVGVIPVCDGDRLVGMLTDRDIVTRVIAEKRDPHATRVREAMTSAVISCYEDDDVQGAARRMAEEQIRRLAVLGHDQRLVGIVSLGDLAVHTADTRLGGEVLETVSEPNK
jgi:CBS domain-containing protein